MWVVRGKVRRQREKSGASAGILNKKVLFSGRGITGLMLIVIGIYVFVEMATGFSTDFFVLGLVHGYGADVTPYQQAIPLLIMVVTLLVIPKGIVSLNFGRLWKRS